MLTTETLMARALRYVLDENKLTPEALITIPGPLKANLQDLAIDIDPEIFRCF